jgi:hypothetical protein
VTLPYLYRGVSRTLYEATHCGLAPKIRHPFKVVLENGSSTYVDPGIGISTTPHQARAEYYALGGGLHKDGVVYVLDRTKLREHGIRAFSLCVTEVSSWAIDDDEVILCGEHGSAILRDVIVAAYDHGT